MPEVECGPLDGASIPNDPEYEYIMLTRYNKDEPLLAVNHVYRQVAGRIVYQPEATAAANTKEDPNA